jgi:hypothetical protein
MSVSIKVKMNDSDEDPDITSGLKKEGYTDDQIPQSVQSP